MGTGAVTVCETPAAAMAQAAERFVALAQEAVEARGTMRVALAGGRTPETLYRRLADSPCRERVEWKRCEVFWGDERCVAPDHPESNYRMAREAMLWRLPIPAARVHRMPGEFANPRAAAEAYEQALRESFGGSGGGPPKFDLILLGLGPDGHTASLFPGTAAVREGTRWVAAVWVAKLGAWRITLTPPVLNASRHVLFLVTGADKAEVLREVLEGREEADRLPAQVVRPVDGRVEWILDREAAGRLTAFPKGNAR